MEYSSISHAGDALILKRRPFEGVATTLDFSSVTDTDANGKKIVYAGSPISNGVVDNTATVEGILLFDVTEDRPVATIVKKAYIDTTKAQANVSKATSLKPFTYASAVKTALPMVVFE